MKLPGQGYSKNDRIFFLVAFVILYIFSVIIHLGYYPLNGDEPRRAIVAIEMRHSGNFIMPTTLGWEYYNKPPLYNWIISALMFITGSESEWVVRLPSLIAILFWSLCNFQILKKIVPFEVAALSSLFLVTSLDIFFWGLNNGGEIDIFYSFIVYLQVISIFYYNEQKNWLALYLSSYLFCAVGLLTKGFPSILFQGLTLTALGVYNKSLKVLFRWQHLAGIGLATAVIGSYLYAYSFYSSPGKYAANLLKEAFNKSAFGEYQERLIKKIIEYPSSFLKILLPWSLLLMLLFKRHQFRIWSYPIIRFCILFIVFNIPVYWFTGHPRMRYAYMFVPFSILILAYIYYLFKKEYPAFISTIVRTSIWFLPIAFIPIIIVPFVYSVNYVWLVAALVLFILFFSFYKRFKQLQLAYFITGIVLLRLTYAMVVIPASYQRTEPKYDKQMAAIAVNNQLQPVSLYHPPDTLNLTVDIKIFQFHFGTIPSIPYFAYQMPYYYYRTSGQIVKYDTVIQSNKTYIGFESTLKNLRHQVLYAFVDRNQNNDSIVLFRVPEIYADNK